MELEKLDDYNARRIEEYRHPSDPMHNGIACPKCGNELQDINTEVKILKNGISYRTVSCAKCGFNSQRVL